MRLVLIILAATMAAMGSAQNIDTLGQPPVQSSKALINLNAPIELRLGENGWQQSGGPYSQSILFGLLAEMVNSELGADVGSSTREIIDEGYQRDELINSKWVADSRRLKEKTLVPSETLFEISTGGSNGGGSRERSISIGGVNVSIESGSATAIIVVVVKDLTTGRRIATLVGKAKYSSTNVQDFSVDKLFHGFRVGNQLRFSQWDNDPEFRRGMIATTRALEDLRKQMRALKSTGR